VGGSNLESAQRIFADSQGVDVGPSLRDVLTGHTNAVPPELAAGLAAYLDLLDPEVEIDMTAADVPDIGVLRGRQGMREVWGRWMEEWDHYSWIVSNWGEVGDHVVFDAEIHATGRSSGAEVMMKQCQVWTFRRGKVIRYRVFKDRAAALAVIENA
jgi:ketosteroid isomerase-like protein